MTLALTSFHAYDLVVGAPSKKRIQRVRLGITGLAADNALDLATAGGTFWVAALANATYGSLATKALAIMQAISANAAGLHAIESPQLLVRQQIASGTPSSANQFSVSITSHLPVITVQAADAPTSWSITLEWALNDGIMPLSFV